MRVGRARAHAARQNGSLGDSDLAVSFNPSIVQSLGSSSTYSTMARRNLSVSSISTSNERARIDADCPVNFGDPFGLCPFEKDQIPCPDGIERIGVTDPRSIGIMLSAAILVEAGAAVGSTVRLVFGIVKDVASTLTRSTTRNDVGPGQNASSSVPSSTTGKAPREEQEAVNEIGSATGCHTCGARAPGTKSGNWVGDHQPPTSLNTRGLPQRLFPQCASCSREQGLTIIKYLKGIGAIK